MKQHGREGCDVRAPGRPRYTAHRHRCRAMRGLPPPRRVLILPARWQSQSSHARGRATNPPTPALSPPFLLWSKPWGRSLCAPELGCCWKCQRELKQERNGGCSTARTVVLGKVALLPYKNHLEASTDADFAP